MVRMESLLLIDMFANAGELKAPQSSSFSAILTYIVIGVCALVVATLVDVTFMFWKGCGFTHTFLLMCCEREVGPQRAKPLYDFEAAERRYLMTLHGPNDRSKSNTPHSVEAADAGGTNLALQFTPATYDFHFFLAPLT